MRNRYKLTKEAMFLLETSEALLAERDELLELHSRRMCRML